MFEGHYVEWRINRLKKLVDLLGGEKYIKGLKVLELAAGHGGISAELLKMGAIPTATDGRVEHVDYMKHHLHGVNILHVDQRYPYSLGKFDLVIHWGVLYHLHPDRWMHDLADAASHAPILCVETEVCDSENPECILRVEEQGYDQSLEGVGTRPSAAAVEKVFRDIGLEFTRYDSKEINSFDSDIFHQYDWAVKNTNTFQHGLRRFWMCRHKSWS